MTKARRWSSPTAQYHDGVAAQRWQQDPAQRSALQVLEDLHAQLQRQEAASADGLVGKLHRWLGGRQPAPPRGVYLWGPVGRGKSFLMDLFVGSLPPKLVQRRHFHHFMGEVHAALKKLGHHRDPLPQVVADMTGRARVLCLDEFLVDDIGDAMILYGLLRGLVAQGVTLVTTSNTPPAELYRDGLQRARFEPAIALLQRHCRIVELASDRDWRRRRLEQAQMYHNPPGPDARRELERIFRDYADGATHGAGRLTIHGRPVDVRRHGDHVAWFDFEALCEGPRSRADYTELARRLDAIMVSRVPVFTPDNHDAAKRFIHLVDACYDCRVKLILSAAAPIVDLYEGDRLRAEFARTESRLIEMQSRTYLAMPHVGARNGE